MNRGRKKNRWRRYANEWTRLYTVEFKSAREIAEMANCAHDTVCRVLRWAGVVLRDQHDPRHYKGGRKVVVPPDVVAVLLEFQDIQLASVAMLRNRVGCSLKDIRQRVGYLELSGYVERPQEANPDMLMVTEAGRDAIRKAVETTSRT